MIITKNILISAIIFIMGFLTACDNLPWGCHAELKCNINEESEKFPGDAEDAS